MAQANTVCTGRFATRGAAFKGIKARASDTSRWADCLPDSRKKNDMDRTELFDEYLRTLARPAEATLDGFANFLVAKLNTAQHSVQRTSADLGVSTSGVTSLPKVLLICVSSAALAADANRWADSYEK